MLDLAVIAVAILVCTTLGLLAWTLGVSTTRALRRARRDPAPGPAAAGHGRTTAARWAAPGRGAGGGTDCLRRRRMTDQRPSGYRGALPTRNDTIARPWVLAVIAIFVLMFVLSFLGFPASLFRSCRARRIPASCHRPLPRPRLPDPAKSCRHRPPSRPGCGHPDRICHVRDPCCTRTSNSVKSG